jgi:2-iminobutanoate/2-iminopropanoate deaminase
MRKTILGWIEEDRNAFADFLARLVRISSPNPPGEARNAAFPLAELAARGVAVHPARDGCRPQGFCARGERRAWRHGPEALAPPRRAGLRLRAHANAHGRARRVGRGLRDICASCARRPARPAYRRPPCNPPRGGVLAELAFRCGQGNGGFARSGDLRIAYGAPIVDRRGRRAMAEARSPRIVRVTSPQVKEPPPATWSNCLIVDGIAYVAGMIARGNDGAIIAGDEYQQAKTIFAKIGHLLEAAGGAMADVVKLSIFVTDIAQREKVWRARREVFNGNFPVSTLVEVAALAAPDVKVEIEAIAHIGAGVR